MGSSTTDQKPAKPPDSPEPSSDIDATRRSREPIAGAADAAVDGCAAVPAGHGSSGEYFSDFQETVISKDRPVVQSSSSDGGVTVIAGTPKQLGEMLEGTTLEHLKLEKFVGGGGMGAVFRALDTNLNRTVAVKVLSGDRTDPDTQQRFQKEAQNAAQLDHRNIAQVFHVGEAKGLHYIVFEFIEGVNIRDLVKQKGPLPLEEAISYMLQVAEALNHASQRDIVHRDIKPSNVLVTAQGRAKLVDMGLARLHHLESESEDLTASGVTLGTFDYISPEQARDPRLADVRSDLYSLGCTFYFMLTGRPPFPDGTVLQKLLRHSSEQPADPRQARAELDEEVVEVVVKLLAKQPRDRYQQPRELIDKLHGIADRLNLRDIARDITAPSPFRARAATLALRSLPLAIPLALLLVAVFTMGKVWPNAASVDRTRAEVDYAPQLEDLQVGPPAEADEGRDGGSSEDASGVGKDAEAAPEVEPKPNAKPASSDGGTSASEADTETSVPDDEGESSAPKTTKPAVEKPDANPERPTAAPAGDSGTSGPSSPADDPSAKEPPGEPDDSPQPKSGMPSAKPQNALAERILVGPVDGDVPDGTMVAESLAVACQKAAAMGVDTVELHFNGELYERPFEVTAKQLTIRNGKGFTPTIIFQPSSEDMALDRQMIRLGTVELNWQGVHLRFELPRQSAGWSLFRLRHMSGLQMWDSTVTVRVVDDGGKPLQADAAVFEVENGGGLGVPAATEGTGPYIRLQQCIVRGRATVVRTKDTSPFRFSCKQCLLVSSDRLLDARETRTGDRPAGGLNNVTLEHVTAVLGQGMCRFWTDDATFRPAWLTESTNSIVYVTDLQAPIIEWKGISGIDDIAQPLYVQKGCNFYPGSMTLLRVNPTGDPSQYMNYDFGQHDAIWYLEDEPPRFALSWEEEPPLALTEDLQTPANYTIADREDNPARNVGDGTPAGADPNLLPTMPQDDSRRPVDATGPPTNL